MTQRFTKSNHWILQISSLRKGREQNVSDSSNHSLHLMKLFNSSSPEGNVGGNQLSLAAKPKYNERFARRYRNEPSPDFSLTLPCSGIIHLLSGPGTCAPPSMCVRVCVWKNTEKPKSHVDAMTNKMSTKQVQNVMWPACQVGTEASGPQ